MVCIHLTPLQQSPVHLSNAWKSGDKILGHAIDLLPNIILACAIFTVFLIVGRPCKSLLERLGGRKRMRQNAALLLGKLTQMTGYYALRGKCYTPARSGIRA
jgi:hypothetical protein